MEGQGWGGRGANLSASRPTAQSAHFQGCCVFTRGACRGLASCGGASGGPVPCSHWKGPTVLSSDLGQSLKSQALPALVWTEWAKGAGGQTCMELEPEEAPLPHITGPHTGAGETEAQQGKPKTWRGSAFLSV